jgi:hypothetical protein
MLDSGKERNLMKKGFVIAVALILALTALAFAGANPDGKIAVHVRPHNAKAGCTVNITSCVDIVTTEPGYSVDAIPVYFDLVEYVGCAYGLTWPAWTYSAGWNNCSDLVIGSIAWPGEGAAHTWTACQTGVMVPSWLWLYADGPGMICPVPHPDPGIGEIQILDCAEGIDLPRCVFCAGVYGAIGDDPCEPTGTEVSTWGEIKGMFE